MPRDSEAYELGKFVQKDLVRQRAYDEKQRLLKRDKQEVENVGKYLWKARHYTDPTCFGSDDDIVRSAREAQMDLADGSVSTIKSNVNPKKLPPAIKPHAGPSIHNGVRHHYTPGSPTGHRGTGGRRRLQARYAHRAGGATPSGASTACDKQLVPCAPVAPPPPWRTFAVCRRTRRPARVRHRTPEIRRIPRLVRAPVIGFPQRLGSHSALRKTGAPQTP